MKDNTYRIVFFPYLNMGMIKEVDLGFGKIWNFDLLKNKYIEDEALRRQVERVVGTFRQNNPYGSEHYNPYQPIKGVGIIFDEVGEIAQEKSNIINEIKLITFISFLSENNTVTFNPNSGHSMATAENFTVVDFSTTIGGDFFSEATGMILPLLSGGISLEQNIYIKPRYVMSPNLRLDNKLLQHLVKLKSLNLDEYNKLITAIGLFYESYYNSPEVSHNSRILMQISSFQVLLALNGGNHDRQRFKACIKRYLTYDDTPIVTFDSERPNGNMPETSTYHEMWGDKFFTLRNHIIHGVVPKVEEFRFNDDWQSHVDIALLFFIVILKRKIEEHLGEEIFGDDIFWKTWKDDIFSTPEKDFSGFKHSNFGKIGFNRAMKNTK